MKDINDIDHQVVRWHSVYTKAAETSENWLGAHRWDYSSEAAYRTIEDIKAKLQLSPKHHVLEVGCGTGMVLRSLLAKGQHGTGVDFCETLLCRGRAALSPTENISLLHAEAQSLPLPNSVFDRVLCYSVFQCFPDSQYANRTIAELMRVCRPGGKILIGDIFGTAEAFYSAWRTHGVSLTTLRASFALSFMAPFLWASYPMRLLFRSIRKMSNSPGESSEELRWRHYSHGFFTRRAGRHGGVAKVLSQDIPGRDVFDRFDVLITKKAPSSQ